MEILRDFAAEQLMLENVLPRNICDTPQWCKIYFKSAKLSVDVIFTVTEIPVPIVRVVLGDDLCWDKGD